MRQFDVVKLSDGSLAILLQANLLDDTRTRVVAPLLPLKGVTPTPKLHPTFDVAGKTYLMATEQLGAVLSKDITRSLRSAVDREWDTRRALDLVFVGV
jgi:toxin CcdB